MVVVDNIEYAHDLKNCHNNEAFYNIRFGDKEKWMGVCVAHFVDWKTAQMSNHYILHVTHFNVANTCSVNFHAIHKCALY